MVGTPSSTAPEYRVFDRAPPSGASFEYHRIRRYSGCYRNGRANSCCTVAHTVGTTIWRRRFADRHFSESHLHMKQAYLLLASERRVLNVVLDDDLDAIQRALGYQTIEHGTTFQTEDQLFVGGDELGGVPQDRFWAAGVPFCLSWERAASRY